MKIFHRKNFLGETRKQAIARRLDAIEQHLFDLEGRITRMNYDHLTEFHKGQEGYVRGPEE